MPLQRIDADAATHPPLFGAQASRRIERALLAALPAHTLMRRAGLSVARLALALAPHARTIWVACGPGNNGGDGFEAALHLKSWGKQPVVTWLGDETRCPADARASLDRARAAGVRLADTPPDDLRSDDFAIDALLGLGANAARGSTDGGGNGDARLRDWLRRLRAGPAPLLAVDLPSGLDADSGAYAIETEAENACTTSRGGIFYSKITTLSLLTLKPGLFTGDGRDAAGEVWFDDLDCGDAAYSGEPPDATLIGAPKTLPRPHASHKGSFGDVAVIGGARGMSGALLLAASAALHAGAGKVYAAPLDDAAPRLDPLLPELMFRAPDAIDLAKTTVVCGCGGGDLIAALLPRVLADAARIVLDADALNAIAADAGLQRALQERAAHERQTVLTPHPLEAARLLGSDAKRVQADRLGAARQLAERFQCCAVLKGSGSIVAAPRRAPALNPTGNARLATAGTGDVLAGMIGAGLAAGHDAFDAAARAAYRHGRIADDWPGDRPLTAGRLARSG